MFPRLFHLVIFVFLIFLLSLLLLPLSSPPGQDEEVPLVREQEEDVFVIDQSSQDFLEVRRADYMGYQPRLLRDSGLLFTPSLLTGSMLASC